MEGKDNLELCQRMQEPFGSHDDAKLAMKCFYSEIETARERWKIADVHVLIKVMAIGEDDELYAAMSALHLGDSALGETMCAWGLAYESELRDSSVSKHMNSGKEMAAEANKRNQEGDQEG